jgi:hypothetical protein
VSSSIAPGWSERTKSVNPSHPPPRLRRYCWRVRASVLTRARTLHHGAAAALSWSFTTRQKVRTARLWPSKKSSKKPTLFNGAGYA